MKKLTIAMTLVMMFVFAAGSIVMAQQAPTVPAVKVPEAPAVKVPEAPAVKVPEAPAVKAPEAQAPTLEKVMGKVVKMSTDKKTITVMVGDKKDTLKIKAKMLKGIKKGDTVEIEKAGNIVKTIKKVEGSTPAAATSTPPVK